MDTSSLQNNFTTLITQPVVLIPIILFVVGVCLFNTYQRLSPPDFYHIQAADVATEPAAKSSLASHDIIAMNLFGTAQATAPTEQNYQDIPETNLRLSLKGAFAHSVQEKASALIAPDVNSKAELFFIGATLPGGAVLDKVYPDYVVIRRNGQLEKLQFLRSQPGAQDSNGAPYSSYEPLIEDEQLYQPPEQYQAPQNAPSAPTSSINNSTNPGSLAEIRERLRQRDQK